MTASTVGRWVLAGVGGLLVVLWLVVAIGSRTTALRTALVTQLQEQLKSDVELQSFSVSIFPRLHVEGAGLRLRMHNQAGLPPLIEIAHFSAEGNVIGLLRRPRRVDLVRLDGLKITIPAGGLNKDDEAGGGNAGEGPVLVQHLVSEDAELRLIPKEAGKEPKLFSIHHLEMASLGFERRMPFRATLTNPVPKGQIATTGTFGPWAAESPGRTPVTGSYTFTNANLDTIKGIGGILSSEGGFTGRLNEIDVKGRTNTPDFSVDVSGQPVPLDTEFHAVVDGTNGNTYLKSVAAKFLDTSLTAVGAVVGTPGVKGRTVQLDVTIPDGRIEDAMRFAVRSKTPVMTGNLTLKTSLLLPPGDLPVPDRLQLDGSFGVGQAKFTDKEVQSKIAGLSKHGRGKSGDEPTPQVVSNLRGRFTLKNGVIRFQNLRFGVPGAQVALEGQYGLRSEALDFAGTLTMQATVSQAVGGGGIKGFFMKAIDPLFKRNGKGAVIPITISGTRSDPKFGLDVKRAIMRK